MNDNTTTSSKEEEVANLELQELTPSTTTTNKRSRKRPAAVVQALTTSTTTTPTSTIKKRKPRNSTSPKRKLKSKESNDTAIETSCLPVSISSPTTKKKTTASSSTSSSSSSSPPKYVLVLDNGSDTIKYGWSKHPDITDTTTTCHSMLNRTARLLQQWTIVIGNDIITRVKNPNTSYTTPHIKSCNEHGSIITNMGNQIQVWKHILDTLNIIITPYNTTSETTVAFGWKPPPIVSNNNNNTTTTTTSPVKVIPSNQCSIMIGIPPYTPRSIIEQIMYVWYNEFQFIHVGLCISTVCAAAAAAVVAGVVAIHIERPITSLLSSSTSSSSSSSSNVKEDNYQSKDINLNPIPIACVVDMGYSSIHIIPVYNKKVIPPCSKKTSKHTSTSTTIRRISFGAKHMINLLKYYYSYRQWNLMVDAEFIIQNIFETTSFVSLNFMKDINLALHHNKKQFGQRYYDCEYILPNYDTTFIGQVRIPESVQIEIDRQKKLHNDNVHGALVNTENNDEDADGDNDDDDDDDDEDEDYNNENDVIMDDDDDDDDDDGDGADDNDEDDDDDEENESSEQIRQRLLQQRDNERRQREIEAEQHQILNISTERFAIPEALFHPTDMGLPRNWANLPQAITQSIEACPPVYRPALYRSIQLTGGLSQLPNLKERLLVELRTLVPCQYHIDITIVDEPISCAWNGIAKITCEESHEKWGVSKEEWEGLSKTGAWRRLQMNEGGHLI